MVCLYAKQISLYEDFKKYGWDATEERKEKFSESHRGVNHPLYGKHHSEETKKKISESHKGKTPYNKGIPTVKLKWITPTGEIRYMDAGKVKLYHKD